MMTRSIKAVTFIFIILLFNNVCASISADSFEDDNTQYQATAIDYLQVPEGDAPEITQTHTIHDMYDVDWYKFYVWAEHKNDLGFSINTFNQSDTNATLTFETSDGSVTSGSSHFFTANEDGYYYLKVSSDIPTEYSITIGPGDNGSGWSRVIGIISDSTTGNNVSQGLTITGTIDGVNTNFPHVNGLYSTLVQSGDHGITASATGYVSNSITLNIAQGSRITSIADGSIQLSPPPNVLPNAAFNTNISGLSVAVDASSSTDSDGSISNYAWAVTDANGTTSTGVSTSFTFNNAGAYTITLTVTDDQGGTHSTSQVVILADSFEDDNTQQQATDIDYLMVPEGEAPEITQTHTLHDTNDVDWYKFYVWEKHKNDLGFSITTSNQSDSNATLSFETSDGSTSQGSSHSFTANENGFYYLKVSSDIPTEYTITIGPGDNGSGWSRVIGIISDSSNGNNISDNLTVTGTIDGVNTNFPHVNGLYSTLVQAGDHAITATADNYISNSIALNISQTNRITSIADGSIQLTRENILPTASFSATVSDLVVTLDASSSSDSDGSITNYAWEVNDASNTTANGISTSFSLSEEGIYTIVLTVTDDRGGTHSFSSEVELSINIPPVAQIVATPTSGLSPLTISLDGSASTDSDGTISSYEWTTTTGQRIFGRAASIIMTQSGIITLSVTDNRGSVGTANISINVEQTTQNTIPEPVNLQSQGVLSQFQNTANITGANNEITLTQNASSFLEVSLPSGFYLLRPVDLGSSTVGQSAGIIATKDGTLMLVSDSGQQITLLAELQASEELASILSPVGLVITKETYGQLQIRSIGLNQSLWFSGRPAYESTLSDDTRPGILEIPGEAANTVFYVHHFVKENVLRQQILYPTPANWDELKQFLNSFDSLLTEPTIDIQGKIQVQFQGTPVFNLMADYQVQAQDSSLPVGTTGFEQPGDENGDGLDDFRIIYSNGDSQIFYQLPE